MSEGFGYNEAGVSSVIAQWEDLSDLMTSTGSDLAGESPSGFAPSLQGAASTFVTAWSGYAGESSEMANGFKGALRSTGNSYMQTDELSAEQLSRLDGRLGPAR